MTSQFFGVQLNSSFGRDFGLLYGHIAANDIATDAGVTVSSDMYNNVRASFQDSKSESVPSNLKI